MSSTNTSITPESLSPKLLEYSNTLTFYLNGKRKTLVNPDPHGTLLDYIRSTGLTGTKLGCSEGGCGACTVVLSSWEEGEEKYVKVWVLN